MIEKIKQYGFLSLLFLLAPGYAYAVAPNTVVATIAVGVNPDGMAITSDNKFAYVASQNNAGFPAQGSFFLDQDNVYVLDLSNNTVKQIISDASFNEPYRIAINPAGTKAYAANSTGTTLTIIDIATNTVSGTIGGFDGPSGIAISPDGTRAYVNNYGAASGVGSGNGTTIRVVDLVNNVIIGAPITVDQAPAGLAMTPDGAFVYVICYTDGNSGTGTVNIIRTSTNTVLPTIITGFSGPFDIAITPNGKYAYVTNFGSNNFWPFGSTVSAIDLSTNSIIATINLSIQPSGVAVSPDSKYVYVTNYNTLYSSPTSPYGQLTPGQGTVNIIDVATNTLLPVTIPVDQSPDTITVSPNGQFAYVTSYTSNTVSVIALQTFQIVAQGCKTENIFLMQRDLMNKLTWSVTGVSLPVSYSIYRDAALTDLVAIVPATSPLQYFDHNRVPNVTYTYYLIGTNAAGTTSTPVVITVTQDC